MLIMLDVGHFPGVGIMFLPMSVPFVIATHASARRVVSVSGLRFTGACPSAMPRAHPGTDRWHQRSGCGKCLSLHALLCTEGAPNKARDILNDIAFVGHVCDAFACEI